MINFTRAFDSAWERMMIILFRPFDLGKWCVIGFSAFLAGLLQGGNGFNTSYRQSFQGSKNTTYSAQFHQFNGGVAHFMSGMQMGAIIFLAAVVFGFAIGFVVLIYWLGARGQFLFLDNIVRNRAEIAAPWKFYARPANAVFVFYLIVLAAAFGILIALLIPALVLGYPLLAHPQWPQGGRLLGLIILGTIYLITGIVVTSIMFIFREWGIPLIFRNGVTVRAAFGESLRLIQQHPRDALLFILLRMALWIAIAILSVLACCFTCCLAVIPYVGTVILLPVLIYVRCFSLDCLAQFGPSYDAWTVDVPRTDIPPVSPPPLLG